MSSVAREPMTSADAAWLHMDRPTNLMVVNAVLWFEEPVELDLDAVPLPSGLARQRVGADDHVPQETLAAGRRFAFDL